MRQSLSGALALALALALATFGDRVAHADGAPPGCVKASIPKASVTAHSGARWIELTHEQWLFMEGVYALDPETPPGLPFGDRAVLATIPEHDGGLIFFVDGEAACTPIPAPQELLDLLRDVATGAIRHAGGAL